MSTHRIYYGRGAQTLTTIPHRGGQPMRVTSATYAILDTRHGADSADHVVTAAGTAATVDTLSTTTTAKAGRAAEDRRALTLTSTAGISAGHLYILEGAKGQAELVTIAEGSPVSATVARTVAEIRGDYATGSTLRGVEVSATFPAIEADDDDNLDGLPFLLTWTFEGLPPLRETVFAERGEESQIATLADLLLLDPTLSLVGGDRVPPASALAQAQRDLRTALQQAGRSEADVLAGGIGRDYVCYRAAYLCLLGADGETAARKLDHYEKHANTLQTSLLLGGVKQGVAVLDKSTEASAPFTISSLFTVFGA